MKHVKDIMSKDVISFGPHDSLFDVAEIFSQKRITGAPVVDGRKVIGMISMSDIMKFMQVKVGKSNFLSHEPHSLSMLIAGFIKEKIDLRIEMKKMSKSMVKDFMNKEVISVDPESTLIDAAEILDKEMVNRLPVIDSKKKLVGILSRSDMLKAMLE